MSDLTFLTFVDQWVRQNDVPPELQQAMKGTREYRTARALLADDASDRVVGMWLEKAMRLAQFQGAA